MIIKRVRHTSRTNSCDYMLQEIRHVGRSIHTKNKQYAVHKYTKKKKKTIIQFNRSITVHIISSWQSIADVIAIIQETCRVSELCDSARAEFCAELTKQRRKCKILEIVLSNIDLCLALTAATASAKHFGVKVIKLFAVLSLLLQLQGLQFQIVTNFTRSVTWVVSWCQKRQRFK